MKITDLSQNMKAIINAKRYSFTVQPSLQTFDTTCLLLYFKSTMCILYTAAVAHTFFILIAMKMVRDKM